MEIIRHMAETDFFVLATIIFLAIFLRANDAYDHELNTHVKRIIWMVLALMCFETAQNILGIQGVSPLLRGVVLGLALILRPWLINAVVMSFRQHQFSKKETVQLLIPCLVNQLVVMSAFIQPYVFTIDENQAVHMGFLSYLTPLACGWYAFQGLRFAKKQRERGFEEESNIIIAAMLIAILGLVVEIAWNLRCVFGGVMTLTVTFYYVYRHMDSSRRDTLTGAFNRASFFADLAKMHPEQITAFCEFDMNNLKKINDEQGHQEGDKAIIAMHAIIQDHLPIQSHLYRFGGDEFAVLFYDVNMSTVYSSIYRIREEFEKSNYGCAIGIAEWKEGNTFREVYNLADELMYEDKKQQKEKQRLEKEKKEKKQEETDKNN